MRHLVSFIWAGFERVLCRVHNLAGISIMLQDCLCNMCVCVCVCVCVFIIQYMSTERFGAAFAGY